MREYGFSVVVDGRSSNWQNIKLILRTLQVRMYKGISLLLIWDLSIPSERAPSKLSENQKIVEFGPPEL